MKILYIFLVALFITCSISAQIINIPDAELKNILTNSLCVDTDGDGITDNDVDINNDGEIQEEEALLVTFLKIEYYTFLEDTTGLEFFSNLETLIFNYPQFANFTLNFNDFLELRNLSIIGFSPSPSLIDSNQLTQLESLSISNLEYQIMPLTDLSILTNLTTFKFNSSNFFSADEDCNMLSDIAFLTNLEILEVRSNSIEYQECIYNIDLSNLNYLKYINFNHSRVDVVGANNLTDLEEIHNSGRFSGSGMTDHSTFRGGNSYDFSNSPNLRVIECKKQNISGFYNLGNLEYLSIDNCNIENLEIINSTSLSYFSCNDLNYDGSGEDTTPFEGSIDVSNLVNLEYFSCVGNDLNEMDLSQNYNIDEVNLNDNDLVNLNIKNGINEGDISQFVFENNPNLQFVCIDPSEFSFIDTRIQIYGNTLASYSPYCSFEPGGETYIVQGMNKLDVNENGCEIDDPIFTHLKLFITNGLFSGYYIPDSSGNYNFELPPGNYALVPIVNNPSYFWAGPDQVIITLPDDGVPFIQDFCVIPNGISNDLEIIIIPLQTAHPGFDTNYKIVYKNNGNTTLSGNINFAFEDDVTTFVSSTPPNESGVSDVLQYSFTDLLPFESRVIDVVMNLNAPTDTPPLNDGDILTFNTSIEYSGTDETPDDNMFELNQTVVNSFDPNDKTCLEGEYITPEMVGDYVHYMIRFENTGTANAINIVVKDIIDITKYEMSSLVPINASHDFVTRITNNVVEFIFEDINLPFDDANNDGYVVFKIKTLDTLVLDDTFENEAEIYFDFNFPIITNTAGTTVQVLSVDDFEFDSNISIYPNPVQDELFINAKEAIKSISIYDLSGRLVSNKSIIGNQIETSISTENLSASVYFIKVKTTENEFTKRVVKK